MESLSFTFNQKLDYPRDLRSAIVGGRADWGMERADCVLNELSEMCA